MARHAVGRAGAMQLRGMGTVPFLLADIGEGIAEVEIMSWHVKEGDTVAAFDDICSVQSDKASVDITSRYDGVVTKVHYEVGDMASVGTPLIDIEVEGEGEEAGDAGESKADSEPAAASASAAAAAAASSSSPASKGSAAAAGKALATPAVRRLAKEHDIDISHIEGTGKAGRVLKGDILAFINGTQAAAPASTPAAAPLPVVTAQSRREPIRGITRLMVTSMKAALQVPHFGYNDEVDMSQLVQLKPALAELTEEKRISYMPVMLKAASIALSEFPVLNSSISSDEQEQIFHGEHNIGVAMDTPRGLLVPNIKNCEQRSVLEIAQELGRLQELGRQNKLGEEDLSGGTFTLSNIGAIGGTYASPVLMVPQVAIGALGKIQRLPRFVNDSSTEVEEKFIMNVSWSADHRVIDGATMATFSNRWKAMLENPGIMVASMR